MMVIYKLNYPTISKINNNNSTLNYIEYFLFIKSYFLIEKIFKNFYKYYYLL